MILAVFREDSARSRAEDARVRRPSFFPAAACAVASRHARYFA
jgi:hypothetical protein